MKPTNRIAKLELIGGQAKPGPVIASLGINIAQFTKDFNERTKDKNGDVVPVVVTIAPNKSFTFVLKTTPTPILLKKALNLEKASSNAKLTIVGTITMDKIKEIAKYKLVGSNANDVEGMEKMVMGTARQMGISIKND